MVFIWIFLFSKLLLQNEQLKLSLTHTLLWGSLWCFLL